MFQKPSIDCLSKNGSSDEHFQCDHRYSCKMNACSMRCKTANLLNFKNMMRIPALLSNLCSLALSLKTAIFRSNLANKSKAFAQTKDEEDKKCLQQQT